MNASLEKNEGLEGNSTIALDKYGTNLKHVNYCNKEQRRRHKLARVIKGAELRIPVLAWISAQSIKKRKSLGTNHASS